MQMSEIIEGLNSSEFPPVPPQCNNVGGCGFGSWIWILLILFYSNNQNRGCGCNKGCKQECCGGNDSCTNGAGGYLFLLVILFLCGCGGGCGNGYDGLGFDGCMC